MEMMSFHEQNKGSHHRHCCNTFPPPCCRMHVDIQKNVILVVGTSDILTPQLVTARMAGQINGSWLERYNDLPHIWSRDAPVQYGENTLDFLGREEHPPILSEWGTIFRASYVRMMGFSPRFPVFMVSFLVHWNFHNALQIDSNPPKRFKSPLI